MPSARPNVKSGSIRQAVLAGVLQQVPFDGWTTDTYNAALKQIGMTNTEADKLFPRGIADVISYFNEATDAAMLAAIDGQRGFARQRVRDKVSFAVRARLEYLAPHREAMRRLLIWYALPQHLPFAFTRLAKTVDIIWRQAGDEARDFNYYTKRILLSAILKATVVYWLDDESPDSAASWGFLDRRIGDVMKLGKGVALLKEFSPSEIGDFVRRKFKRD